MSNPKILKLICSALIIAALPLGYARADGIEPAVGASLTVTKVDLTTGGSLPVHFSIGSKNQDITVTWNAGTDATGIANLIRDQINANFDGEPALTIGTTVMIENGNGLSAVSQQGVDIRLNAEGFSIDPGVYFAVLGLEANPLSGQDTLVTPATITAGFANGLSPVSFDAAAGQTLEQLAASLNTALDADGYVTTLVSPTQIAITASGVLGPTELDFTVSPIGDVGDQGIAYSITEVPEAPTLLLLGIPALCWIASRLTTPSIHSRGDDNDARNSRFC